MTIVAGTGHRPEKIRIEEDELRELIRTSLNDARASVFICGMAAGYDLIAGTTALRMGLEVWAAKPWLGHSPRKADVQLYAEVIEGASRVVAVNESQDYLGPWVYQRRNEWMVDNSDFILAYWDGSSGGTANCIKYAKQVGKHGRNIYG